MRKRNSPILTADMAATIKYLVGVLGLHQHQAAAIIGINQGRVSEVMTGKRFAGVPPARQFNGHR